MSVPPWSWQNKCIRWSIGVQRQTSIHFINCLVPYSKCHRNIFFIYHYFTGEHKPQSFPGGLDHWEYSAPHSASTSIREPAVKRQNASQYSCIVLCIVQNVQAMVSINWIIVFLWPEYPSTAQTVAWGGHMSCPSNTPLLHASLCWKAPRSKGDCTLPISRSVSQLCWTHEATWMTRDDMSSD